MLLGLLFDVWIGLGAGLGLERAVGTARTWILFVGSALAGGVANALGAAPGAGTSPLGAIGAAAGVFGWVAALGVIALGTPGEASRRARRSLVFFLLVSVAFAFLPGSVWIPLAAGFVAGAAGTFLLGPRRSLGRPPLATTIAATILLLLAGGAVAMPLATLPTAVERQEIASFLDDLEATERRARQLYDRPDLARPAERLDLARRLADLRSHAPLSDASDREALAAWLDAWDPVVRADVPDPFAFERALASAEARWRPVRDRLRSRAGARPR